MTTIRLAALNGKNGFRLDGSANDRNGFSVSSAGDVNGDGFEDVIVGAWGADANGTNSGSSYVVFGKASKFAATINLAALNGSTGFRLDGAASGDQSGWSVSGAGDVNGDGFDDLIVGAKDADPKGLSSGSSFVVFGKASGFSSAVDLGALDGSNGFRLDGVKADDNSGFSVSSAGDVNGDGLEDLIVGAYAADPNGASSSGSSYVVFGKASGFSSAINLRALDGSNGFRLDGAEASDRSGFSVSSAGDVNGDGFADLIVGAHGHDAKGAPYSGQSYVVYGKATRFPSAIDLGASNDWEGLRLNGAASDQSGFSVSIAGDVNGDGFDDLIVGAPAFSAFNSRTYVVFGKASAGPSGTSSIDLETLDGANGFRLYNVVLMDQGGCSVSNAGDVNGDGFDDLIVAATGRSESSSDPGSSYVVFGKASGFSPAISLGNMDSATGFRLDGVSTYGDGGTSVSSAGDVNGDGFDDLIIGTDVARNYGSFSGSSYVVFGSATIGGSVSRVTHRGTDADDLRTGTAGPNVMMGGRGHDTLVGGGGEDVLYGAEGDDLLIVADAAFRRIDGGTGQDTLELGGFAVSDEHFRKVSGVEVISLGNQATTLELGPIASAAIDGLAADGIRITIDTSAVSDAEISIDGSGLTRALTADFAENHAAVNLQGGRGADVLEGGADGDMLNGGAGRDRLLGNAGDENLLGGAGSDVLTGGDGEDRLLGGGDDDKLAGGADGDTLTGGVGSDLLAGGRGGDRFDFNLVKESTARVQDTIADFSRVQGDKIDLSSIDADETVDGNQKFSFVTGGDGDLTGFALTGPGQVAARVVDGGVLIEANVDADPRIELSIFVRGVTSLEAGDFIL